MRKRSDGIKSIADLRDRCRIDTITGCWLYGPASADQMKTPPSVWLAAEGRVTSLGGLIGYLLTGESPIAGGPVWHRTCGSMRCANPAHRAKGTQHEAQTRGGRKLDAAQRTKISAAMRLRRRPDLLISDEQAAELRQSGETNAEAARRIKVSRSYISQIRSGSRRAGASSEPQIAVAHSVFTWRPAA